MYKYIAKVTLRIALIAQVITYAVTAWNLHQKYLDDYIGWSQTKRVFDCLSKVPESKLRAAENAFGNFDARKFHCIYRDAPYWTNIMEVRDGRAFKEVPDYWTKDSYHLELIPLVAVAVVFIGAFLAGIVWLVRWIFGIM